MTATPTALYRFFDEAGDLLYIGVTHDMNERRAHHRVNQKWWPEVASESVEWLDTRPLALAAEREAINSERPRHNWVHNDALNAERRDAVAMARKADEKRPWTSGEAGMGYAEVMASRAEARGDADRAAWWLRIKAEVDRAPEFDQETKDRLRILLRPS